MENYGTKYCKYCGAEISADSAFCERCGKELNSTVENSVHWSDDDIPDKEVPDISSTPKKKSIGCTGCLIAVFLFIVILFAIGTCSTKNTVPTYTAQPKSDVAPQTLTIDKFYRIRDGMSYYQVKKLLGFDGTLTSSAGSDDYRIETFVFQGEGISNIAVTFTNNKVSAKAQIGLN